MIRCPMIDKGWGCKSSFTDERQLSRHLVEAHSAFDVADLLVDTLKELQHLEDTLTGETKPNGEKN